jgi:hypothetical protein
MLKCRIVFPTDLTNRSCKSRISSRVKSPQDASARLRQHMQGGAKRKRTHHLAEQLHARASLSTRSSGRPAPALGDQHLPCLPGSGVAQKLAAVELEQSTSRRRAGGRWRWLKPSCRLRRTAAGLKRARMRASKPHLVDWIGKFSVL